MIFPSNWDNLAKNTANLGEYISGLTHNEYRLVNFGIKWSHQYGLQVGLESYSRVLHYCRAAARYPFCSKDANLDLYSIHSNAELVGWRTLPSKKRGFQKISNRFDDIFWEVSAGTPRFITIHHFLCITFPLTLTMVMMTEKVSVTVVNPRPNMRPFQLTLSSVENHSPFMKMDFSHTSHSVFAPWKKSRCRGMDLQKSKVNHRYS